jgi:hypothetical protein
MHVSFVRCTSMVALFLSFFVSQTLASAIPGFAGLAFAGLAFITAVLRIWCGLILYFNIRSRWSNRDLLASSDHAQAPLELSLTCIGGHSPFLK